MSHINNEQWEELLDLFEEDFIELVTNFVKDSQKRIEIIKKSHQEGDNSNGLEEAHALKGASANLGAETLSKHCFTMQSICQANMIQHAFNVVEDIENEFAKVEEEINKRLAKLANNQEDNDNKTKNNPLDNIQIVMINTTLPANIGSTARAMHTMGLSNLTLVSPKLPIDDTSIAHAGGGLEVLNNAQEVTTLQEAIADSQLIFACSSRSRHMPRPVINPIQSAKIIADFFTENNSKNNNAKISILFGREDRGLTNEELATADYHIQIDANPNYPVLNVASAVQVVASFIYSYFSQLNTNNKELENDKSLIHTIRQEWDEPAINQQQQEQLTAKMIELMQNLELADNNDLRLLPQRLSRLSSRLQLDIKEYQLIMAVLGKLQKKLL